MFLWYIVHLQRPLERPYMSFLCCLLYFSLFSLLLLRKSLYHIFSLPSLIISVMACLVAYIITEASDSTDSLRISKSMSIPPFLIYLCLLIMSVSIFHHLQILILSANCFYLLVLLNLSLYLQATYYVQRLLNI